MPTVRLTNVVDNNGEFGLPGQTWIMLQTSYNPQFVAVIKDSFRPAERRWDKVRHAWFVDGDCRAQLLALIVDCQYTATWVKPPPGTGPAPQGRTRMASLEDYSVLQVAPHACLEVVRAAWRALVQLHHPDRGGNPARLIEVNMAWDRVKSTFTEPPF